MPLYSRRELVLLLAVVLLGAAGIAIDRWRHAHPELAANLESLDRSASQATSSTPRRLVGAGPPQPLADRPSPAQSRRRASADPAPVDLNLASREDLERLPGVSPALAARIVEARARDGPFASVDDLRRVRGVGRATLERVRPLLAVNTP